MDWSGEHICLSQPDSELEARTKLGKLVDCSGPVSAEVVGWSSRQLWPGQYPYCILSLRTHEFGQSKF